jgi:hypothetical protein
MRRVLLIALVAACAALPGAGISAIPETISFQGVLRDAAGEIVPDGPYEIQFMLYDAEQGGDMLWEEMQTLEVTDGVFNAILGSMMPFAMDFADQYWLSVAIMGEPELEPRVALSSSPYALRANFANFGQDSDWTIAGGDVYRLMGNVGIRTSAPGYALDVADTARVNALRLPTGATDGAVLTSNAAGDATWQVPSSGGMGGAGTTGSIPVFVAPTTLGNSVLFENLGNVGTGTVYPAAAIEVRGDDRGVRTTSADSLFMAEMRYDAIWGPLLQGVIQHMPPTLTLDAFSPGVGDAGTIILGKMGDAVGIGTTTPGSRLEVIGAINSKDSAGENTRVTMRGYSQHGVLNIVYAEEGKGLRFQTDGETRMLMRKDGNIGIGTMSPERLLDVAGTARMEGFELTTGVAEGNVLMSDSLGVGSWKSLGSLGFTLDDAYDGGGGGAGRTIVADSGSVYVSGPDGLTVDGKVGIGLTNPNKKLYVHESQEGLVYPLKLHNAEHYPDVSVGILFAVEGDNVPDEPDTTAGKGALVYEMTDTGGRGDFHFLQNTESAWERNPAIEDAVMTIQNDGDVGIGTTDPVSTFEVAGDMTIVDDDVTIETSGETVTITVGTHTTVTIDRQEGVIIESDSIEIVSTGNLDLTAADAININSPDINVQTQTFDLNATTRADIAAGAMIDVGAPNINVHGVEVFVTGAGFVDVNGGLITLN